MKRVHPYCRKWRVVAVVFFALGLFSTFHLGSMATYAASISGDPLVAIAVDITKQSPCTETFRVNIGTPYESTTSVPCSADTVTEIKLIPRSQAEARHEPYVVYPSSQASVADRQKARLQLQQLTRKQALADLRPLTNCGNNGSAALNWQINTPYGPYSYYSTISYFKSSDCKVVQFDTAAIYTQSSGGSGLDYSWVNDLYAGHNYGPGCPTLTQGTWHSYSVGQSAPPGYYYENWVDTWGACTYGFPRYHNDIPIN